MEVKIKHNGELVDASIEVVDGVMVVRPKEEKGNIDLSQFKDGDIITYNYGVNGISTVAMKGEVDIIGEYFFIKDYFGIDSYKGLYTGSGYSSVAIDVRHATDEEKKLLLDRLKEEGFEWDEEKKELVEIKWKPKEGEDYFSPTLTYSIGFHVDIHTWENRCLDNNIYDRGWAFKNIEKCEQLCQKLNQAIEGVKP